jgi:serine O-acetyltransferase
VLGPLKIGSNSKIASNAVVLHEVPENSTAVGIPAKVVKRNGQKVKNDLDQIHIPDPVAQELCRIERAIANLESRMADMKGEEKHENA